MNPQKFLENLVKKVPEYKLTEEDKKTIEFEGIEKYIYNKLTSAKYRSSSIDKDSQKLVKSAIHHCVANKKPIHVSLPFGAYKRWNLPTYPYPDWAEVFNIVQLREYLSPIAEAYKYGVILRYYSVELFVEKNNNLPQKEIAKYEDQFLKMLEFFRKYLPQNFKLEFTNLGEEISQEEALKAVEEKVKELRANWKDMPQKDKDLKTKRAKVNCMVEKDDPKYDEKILEAVFVHDAFSSECWAKGGKIKWAFAEDMVPLGHSYTTGWAIHVKSSRSSRVNFWVGMGALIENDGNFIPTILSYEQWEKVKNKVSKEKVGIFPEDLRALGEIVIIRS